MKFKSNNYELYKDQFNYYNLLKKINPGYQLYYNKKHHSFDIINVNNNFELCYSFINFSQNILNHMLFSQIQNYNKVLQNIETNNERIEQNKSYQRYSKTQFSINEINKLNNRSNHINSNDINKIIGATQC